jgi:hypothetical protein
VAIVISLGKNGRGAVSANTGAVNPGAPAGTDEEKNATGPSEFMSRTHSPAGSAAGEFDDIVVWLPRHLLINRMVAAGKLP